MHLYIAYSSKGINAQVRITFKESINAFFTSAVEVEGYPVHKVHCQLLLNHKSETQETHLYSDSIISTRSQSTDVWRNYPVPNVLNLECQWCVPFGGDVYNVTINKWIKLTRGDRWAGYRLVIHFKPLKTQIKSIKLHRMRTSGLH